MRIYYFDTPLDADELSFVAMELAEKEGLRSIQELEQIRIPSVFPIVETEHDMKVDERIRLMGRNLKNAGMDRDAGGHVVIVMPEEFHWGGIALMAVRGITGMPPYSVQRWTPDESGNPVKNIRMSMFPFL